MTTTAIIILSALLGASICINIATSASKKRMSERIGRLKGQISEFKDNAAAGDARYFTCLHINGIYSVYRAVPGSKSPAVLIKRFDTADADYNRNEADELVENLAKTLCYD